MSQSKKVKRLVDALIRYEDAAQAMADAEGKRGEARDVLAEVVGVSRLHGDSSIVRLARIRIGELTVLRERSR